MNKALANQSTYSEIHVEYCALKQNLMEGNLPDAVLKNFHNKVLDFDVNEAVRQCAEEIILNKKIHKRKRIQLWSFVLGLCIFILGTFFPVSKYRNRKSERNVEGKLELNPKSPFDGSLTLQNKLVVPALIPDSLNFCGEIVPLEDGKVSKKVRVALFQTRFTRLETNRLKRKVNKWFPIITPILKRYHIPEDFKYIPLVETGFVNSTSSRGAGGFWQLMEGTARQYGLKVTDSTDERTDVRRCTVAACRYIRDLHKILGSWTLTAAAYNMGPGGLLNKLDDQNKHDYYRLQLNSETSKYVFKTLAFKQILSPPKKRT